MNQNTIFKDDILIFLTENGFMGVNVLLQIGLSVKFIKKKLKKKKKLWNYDNKSNWTWFLDCKPNQLIEFNGSAYVFGLRFGPTMEK